MNRAIVVPEESDPDFLVLEEKINAEFEALLVKVKPIPGAINNDCFNIVQNQVKTSGGRMILGWQVWKLPILIEAEAHAVWEDSPNKELMDISPKNGITVDQILFIEDPRLKYGGKQINNIRLNITNNVLVDHFIKLSDLLFHYQNKGERANYYDLSQILSNEQINEIQEILNWKNNIEFFIYKGGTMDSNCFCDTNKKYKNCHGKNFEKLTKQLKNKA